LLAFPLTSASLRRLMNTHLDVERAAIRKQLLDAKEAAALAAISGWTLIKWRINGRLRPLMRAGHNLVYWRPDVERITKLRAGRKRKDTPAP